MLSDINAVVLFEIYHSSFIVLKILFHDKLLFYSIIINESTTGNFGIVEKHIENSSALSIYPGKYDAYFNRITL